MRQRSLFLFSPPPPPLLVCHNSKKVCEILLFILLHSSFNSILGRGQNLGGNKEAAIEYSPSELKCLFLGQLSSP